MSAMHVRPEKFSVRPFGIDPFLHGMPGQQIGCNELSRPTEFWDPGLPRTLESLAACHLYTIVINFVQCVPIDTFSH